MRLATRRLLGRAPLALAALAAAGVLAACTSPPPEVPVTIADFSIEPAKISIQRAQKTVLKIQNTGSSEHNISIQQLNVATGLLGPGKTFNLEVTAPRGPLKMICSLPGHEGRGMVAEIAVEQSPTRR